MRAATFLSLSPCVIVLGVSLTFVAFKTKVADKSREIQTIISLAPSYSEVVVALDMAHRLIGVTKQCAVKNKARIGSFALANKDKPFTINTFNSF